MPTTHADTCEAGEKCRMMIWKGLGSPIQAGPAPIATHIVHSTSHRNVSLLLEGQVPQLRNCLGSNAAITRYGKEPSADRHTHDIKHPDI
jgi:hypothetical protein